MRSRCAPQAGARLSGLAKPIGNLLLFTALGLAALPTPGASAQGTTILKDVTVLVGDGTVLNESTVSIQAGNIASVGGPPGMTLLARTIDAKGKFLTPGLIDVWSTLGLQPGGEGRATGRAIDAFNPYDRDQILFALQRGVTAVYVPARAGQGVGGRGAVVRLTLDPAAENRVLSEENALEIVLAAGQGPLARVRAVQELRKTFLDAREYREALNNYEDELKEYEEQLKKRQEQGSEGASEASKGESARKEEKSGKPESRRGRGDRPRGDRSAAEGPKPEERKDEKKDEKKDDLKKPQKPERDPSKELLLKVLDGEIMVRIEAEHPEDILNLLDLAREFSLPLILEGASGAVPVAAKLAEAEVPVVLGARTPPLAYVGDASQHQTPAWLAALREAGVSVYFGSGPDPSGTSATQHLALAAARTVSRGLPEADALPMLTSRAAALLGIDKEVGRVAQGLSADLVLWSHPPFDPQARVERVWIAGREVYNAEQQANP